MKQITIWSDENNVFTLESQIIDTELTLVISDLNDDTDIKLNFSYILEIHNSVVKIVTEDGLTHDYPIYFDGGAIITNSKIEGGIQFNGGLVTNCKIEGSIRFDY